MALTEITTPRDIINTMPGTNNRLSKQSFEVTDALNNVTQEAKYQTRYEMDETGLSTIFDESQGALLQIKANKTVCFVTGEKLRYQQQALQDINDVVTKFEADHVKNAAAAGTDKEQVDRAIKAIEIILRRKNSQSEYIFGGNNPKVDPLSVFNGTERISSDLTKTSNIVNGVFVNNYSDASFDETIVTASSNHEVRQNFVFTGMQSIIDTLGFLNKIKEGNSSLEEIAAAQKNQKDSRGEVKILVDLEIKKVVDALDVNKNEEKDVQNTLKMFKGDIVELSGRAGDAMVSLLAGISIQRAKDRLTDHLLKMLD